MKPVIVQFLPELNVGGVERGTIEIARAIVAEGFRSVVVSNGGRLVDQLLNEGSEHNSLPLHKKALASLRLIKKLKPILEETDIAHVRSVVLKDALDAVKEPLEELAEGLAATLVDVARPPAQQSITTIVPSDRFKAAASTARHGSQALGKVWIIFQIFNTSE